MKTSMLMKTVAALAIGAAFPHGAIAAPPAKTMIERGVIEKVNATRKGVCAQGRTPETDGDLRVERFDAVSRERQAARRD